MKGAKKTEEKLMSVVFQSLLTLRFQGL